MKLRALALVALVGGVACAQTVPPGFVDSLVRAGWDQAVGVVFAPDGRAFVWEKGGRVWMMEDGEVHEHPVIDISEEVRNWRDFGLLGLALDPDFMTNGKIYLSYIVDYHHLAYFGTPQYNPGVDDYARDSIGRITRFQLDATDGFHTLVAGSRAVLVGESMSTGIPITHQSHSMGAMVFGEDGTLLIAAGDGASYDDVDTGGVRTGSSNTALADGILAPHENVGALRAQEVDSHNGKILRIDPLTGDGVPGNPFYDGAHPRAPRSRVWEMGLRNPFRMTIRPGTGSPDPATADPGTLYIGDVGWLSFEELNVAPAGGLNFGWPLFEGLNPNSNFQLALTGNPLAPNPLAGSGCPPFVPFRNLLVQDTLAAPRWTNPCNSALDLPATLDRFRHTRPAIEWGRGMPFRCPGFVGNDAAALNVGAPGAPVAGTGFVPNGTSSTGGAWYTGSAFPASYQQSYYHADFVGGWIHQFLFGADDRPTEVRAFATNLGSIVDVEYNAFDQSLYYIAFTNEGDAQLRRISYGLDSPPTAVATPAVAFGPLPLTVPFSSAGSADPEQGTLTYHWDFGDGQTSTLANPTHTFTGGTQPTRFDVVLTVTDSAGNSASRRLLVSGNNTPPSVNITSPVDGSSFGTGTITLPLRASVTDAEHGPGELSCRWQASIHHNTHFHGEPAIADCAPDLVLDGSGHSGETFSWEFRLTVTDGAGLSTTAHAAIFPETFDCNGNGVSDATDIATGASADCNHDGVPDECSIVLGLSHDCNANQIADECEAGAIQVFTLGGGADGLSLNGTARWSDGRVRLTTPNQLETGSAVLPVTSAPVHGFDARFDITLAGPDAGSGVCFVAMNSLHPPFETFGSEGIGYGALVVSFLPRAGGQSDVINLRSDGTLFAAAPIPFELADGQPHRAHVSVTPDGIEVGIESATGTSTTPIARTRIPLWTVEPRLFGFGASTDAHACEHFVDNITIFTAGELDHNADMVPDACQPAASFDCDGDGIEDWTAIAQGTVPDCNNNLRPDSCDIAQGFSQDRNLNGLPDECDPCPADYTGDGGVDGDDVIAFFGDWDISNPAADIDGSGGVDGDDVILFFEHWDSGC